MARRFSTVLSVAVTSLLTFGCESKESQTHSISGTVSLDGKPLPEGEVYFILPGQAPAIFPVKDGDFSGQARAGKHRVEINAYRARKEKVGSPGQNMTPPPENYIPEKFNTKSELTAQVETAGSKQFKFDVQSK